MARTGWLVVGGDGFLGGALARMLRSSRECVVTTWYHSPDPRQPGLYLDLRDRSTWKIPDGIAVAFLCAAVTSVEECRRNPRDTWQVNVEGTVALASMLAEKKVFVVFPSTNLVFDGSQPGMKVDDPVAPRVEYGRQKAAAEERLLALGERVAVVRFTKILGPGTPLIKGWIEHLEEGEYIHPFSDMVLAPVGVDFAARLMVEIGRKRAPGIWHVSAREDVTYAELARLLARKMGVSRRYVRPVRAVESGLEFETIPEHTVLDTSRLVDELGIPPPGISDAVDSILS